MSSKIVRDVDIIRWQAQTKLADLGSELSQAHLQEGHASEEKEEQGMSLIRLLRALDQSAYLTDEEIENLLYCLLDVGKINSILPVIPSLAQPTRTKPVFAQGKTGQTGSQGPTGPGGADNVLVSSDPAFDNIKITAVVNGPLTDYQLGYNPYVAPAPLLTIDNGAFKEIGALTTVNFTASYVVGRESVTSTLILTPSGFTWTANPQSFGDSALIILTRTVRAYTAEVQDGTSTITNTKNVTFLFPLIFGNDDAILTGAQVYSNLNRLVQDISDPWLVPYSFTDDYGFFAFPEDYNDSNIIIRDENGFDVTDEWQKEIILVDSGTTHAAGGGTDWTKNYKVWRTIAKTDIDGEYKIENVTP